MTFTGSADAPEFATLTHANVRLAQGDVGGARCILRSILAERPDDPGARMLLDNLAGRGDGAVFEVPEEAPSAPVAADPGALRERFQAILGTPRAPLERRIARRFERLLENIAESRWVDRAR